MANILEKPIIICFQIKKEKHSITLRKHIVILVKLYVIMIYLW